MATRKCYRCHVIFGLIRKFIAVEAIPPWLVFLSESSLDHAVLVSAGSLATRSFDTASCSTDLYQIGLENCCWLDDIGK